MPQGQPHQELTARPARLRGLGLVLGAAAMLAAPGPASAADSVERGAYIFDAAGCRGCHTDEKGGGGLLAGGVALKTPFGTFYPPNITPDPEHGIGAWSEGDFIRALGEGITPNGANFFPAFPYTSYTGMTRQDMLDLRAYILTVPAVARENRPHELDFPYSWRFLVTFWKWLYFTPGPLAPDLDRDEAWNRGAYIVRAMSHCGECHTPRNALGGFKGGAYLSGTLDGPDGEAVPNITPDLETGIGDWSTSDITFMLNIGILPDGDAVGSAMGEVVENSTGKLSDDDRHAIATFVKSVPPVVHTIERKAKTGN